MQDHTQFLHEQSDKIIFPNRTRLCNILVACHFIRYPGQLSAHYPLFSIYHTSYTSYKITPSPQLLHHTAPDCPRTLQCMLEFPVHVYMYTPPGPPLGGGGTVNLKVGNHCQTTALIFWRSAPHFSLTPPIF